MTSTSLRPLYEPIAGYYLDLYKVKSLSQLTDKQMFSLLENIFDELNTGITMFSSAEEDMKTFNEISESLKVYRNIEKSVKETDDIAAFIKMPYDELKKKFLQD